MTTSPVMTVTDELLAELELLASKATQGEWWIDSHGHTMIATDSLDVVFSMPSTKGAVRHPETGNLSSWRNDLDASYIAAANPKNMQTLLGELRRLRAENAELARDAERYRWMCSVKELSVTSDGSTWTRQNGRAYVSAHTLCANGSQYAGRETLSEAIDTAMATQ